jgi:hypothetical protein
MRTYRSSATLVALVLLPVAGPLSAQTIRGRVLDAASGDPVPQAAVTVLTAGERTAGRARTGVDGAFVIQLREPGTFRLRGERAGYLASSSQAVEVAVRETVVVALRVSPQALQIEPLTVTSRIQPPRNALLTANGFYHRESGGFGKFVRREDLDRHPEHNMVTTLARLPGVEIAVDGRGRQIASFTRGRTVGTLERGQTGKQDICFPLVFLDGVRMRYGPPDDVEIDGIVNPTQIEAIELYRSAAEIPSEFNGTNSACGVIVIWTRHDIAPIPTR